MSTGHDDERLDRELLQEQLQAAVLRGQLGLVTGEDEDVSVWLGELAVHLSDDTEVIRIDASQGYSAPGLVQDLVNALDVAPDDLLASLQNRAATLPVVLVVDNGECLGSRALDALRNLLAKGGGGLGVLMGGEPELSGLLAEARLEPGYRATADDTAAFAGASESGEAVPGPWREWIPWKHLSAVVGLLLLVWLFWPAEQSDGQESRTALDLPPPASRSGGSGAGPSDDAGDVTKKPGQEDRSTDTAPPADSPPGEPVAPEQPMPPAATGEESASIAGDANTEKKTAKPDAKPSSLDAELAYRGEDWLLTRPPEQWMLQLALAADEERARKLMDRLGSERGAYYRARRDGEVVYIVLAGPYGSRNQALGARSDLPGAFAERGPFPRPVDTIAAEIQDG